ncbi:sulfotransferase domain-containing protein [Roseobacter sp. YSTF-M11]|uniref:Sulfotransferase domain-containing protein n=1 Tax=Roseobacter insulae TaxID=2859783 RepID=A0A9X1G0Q0_9RHOB|nr:sulfotransferase domain-containing protein [Roseobacter insulae]MBW4710779.1 sulfotransferase domain-containing protein [Roseobacter insulae]
MRPDFIVIGAMKCGTSTICAYLEDHEDVFMVPRAEPNFFSHDDRFAQGVAAYEAHFDAHRGEKLCGEGSNDYGAGALYPQSADRMAAYHPGLKLIYIARHPLERIASAWIQNRANSGDQVPPTLDLAVTRMPDLFVDQSLYWKNLSRYRAHFPDAQIFVGFMEDLSRDRAAFFERLCEFLEIPPSAEVRRAHMNPSSGKVIPSQRFSAVNRLPFIKTAKKILPKALKTTVKRELLSQKITERPDFSDAIKADILKTVRPDAERFLAHCGKPADFWTFG